MTAFAVILIAVPPGAFLLCVDLLFLTNLRR